MDIGRNYGVICYVERQYKEQDFLYVMILYFCRESKKKSNSS